MNQRNQIVVDFAKKLAEKYFLFREELNSPVIPSHLTERQPNRPSYSLYEYTKALKSVSLTTKQISWSYKAFLLLLFGTGLYQRNGIDLWTVALFFHNDPVKALSFLGEILSENSPLLKENCFFIQPRNYDENIQADELVNFYKDRPVYLSPILFTKLISKFLESKIHGIPRFSLPAINCSTDEFLMSVSLFMENFRFYSHLFKHFYSLEKKYTEDIYKKGDFSIIIRSFQNKIKKIKLDIELIQFLNNNHLSPIEFTFLMYMVDKLIIRKEFGLNNIEEILSDLTFFPSQVRSILNCFSNDHVFVTSGIIDATDFFNPSEDNEVMDDIESLLGSDEFGLGDFDFNGINISKEKLLQMIFKNPVIEEEKENENLENEKEQKQVPAQKEKIRNMGLFEIQIPRVTLKNVILDPEVEKDLMGAVDMTKTIDTMKKWGVKPTLSSSSFTSIKILFYGPSGTGKTITAEALAGQADAELFKVDASNLVTSWVGESAKNVKKVFKEFYKYVKTRKKRVFMFFNEADQLLSARGPVVQAADKEYNQMQNLLLEELENFDGVFIATTNLIDLFDSAWNRRFTIKIKFDIPTYKTRLNLWKLHISSTLPLSEDVDINRLAEAELAGGAIANVVYNAARKAALRHGKHKRVTQKDFMDAIHHEKLSKIGGTHHKVGFSS